MAGDVVSIILLRKDIAICERDGISLCLLVCVQCVHLNLSWSNTNEHI